MRSMEYSAAREAIIAAHLEPVIKELLLVDPADYIAFIRCELLANIADIVQSAAELHFMPGVLRFGHGGDYKLGWLSSPEVALDLEFQNMGVHAYFRIVFAADAVRLNLHHISFERPDSDPDNNTSLFSNAFEQARYYSTAC
ncbi:MAG: hypothetical protein ACRECW_08875 [Phyllobacterium sp.]